MRQSHFHNLFASFVLFVHICATGESPTLRFAWRASHPAFHLSRNFLAIQLPLVLDRDALVVIVIVPSLPIMSTPTTSPQTAEEKYNLSMFCDHHYQRPVACLARKISADCSDCSRSQPPRGYEPRDHQGYPREE